MAKYALIVISVSIGYQKGIIFFSLLILFEFIVVLADHWSGGAPGIKLMWNAVLAGLIFPVLGFFERFLKRRLIKRKRKS